MSEPYLELAKFLIYKDLKNNDYSEEEIAKKLKIIERIKELEGCEKQ